MKKLATTCLLLFAFGLTVLAAKWDPAIIYTRDGRRIECLTTGAYGTKVTYKLNENAKKEKIHADSIKYVEFPKDDGRINLRLSTPLRYAKKDGSIDLVKSLSKTHWVQLYADPRGSNKTVMFVWTIYSRYGNSYYYGCYRDSDDFGVVLTFGSEEKAIKAYMSDCPAIIDYVNQNGIKIRTSADVQQIIDEYNACNK